MLALRIFHFHANSIDTPSSIKCQRNE